MLSCLKGRFTCCELSRYWLLPLFLLLCLGLLIFRHYGVGVDEDIEVGMVYDNWNIIKRYFSGDFSKPYDFYKHDPVAYGTLFNLIAFPVQALVAKEFIPNDITAYHTKNLISFLFSFMAYAAAGLALWRLTHQRYSMWLIVLLLVLHPFYFAINLDYPKDPPFAALMTVASLILAFTAVRIGQYFQQHPQAAWKENPLIKYAVFTGVVIGLTASQRIAGVILGLHWIVLLIATFTLLRLRQPAWTQAINTLYLAGACAFIVIWVMHPAAWVNPFRWLYDNITYMSHHPHQGSSLFDGGWLSSRDVPWYYVPFWLFSQTPLLWMLMALAGWVLAIARLKKMDAMQRALVIAFTLQCVSLPLYAILAGSHLYSGIRPFVFMIPALALFAGYGIVTMFTLIPTRIAQAGFLAALAGYGLVIASEMVMLHPYQYNYWNLLTRNHVNERWHVDMNVAVSQEAAAWINAYAPTNAGVVVNYGDWLLQRYLRPDLKAYFHRNKAEEEREVLFALSAAGGVDQLKSYTDCRIMHRIERYIFTETVGIGYIRRCK